MKENNDFGSDHRPDLNEYLSHEITDYYGEDMLNKINRTTIETSHAVKRQNRLIGIMGIGCAVMFLTGAVLFTGVLFNSDISKTENDSDISAISTDIHGASSNKSESSTTSFSNSSSEITPSYFQDYSDSSETDSVSVYSSDKNNNSGNTDIYSNTKPDFSSYSGNSNGSSIHTDIDTDSNSMLSSDSDGGSVRTDIDTDSMLSSDSDGGSVRTDIDTDSMLSSDSDSGSVRTDIDTDSDSMLSSDSDGTSTDTDITKDPSDKYQPDNTEDIPHRQGSFSLPQYPDNTAAMPPDDPNNNGYTNPYDNVTTGKNFRTGLGIILMTLSLMAALAINKFKYSGDQP